MYEPRITLGYLVDRLQKIMRENPTIASMAIQWSDIVQENSQYHIQYSAMPGSILFGLTWIEKGVMNGTVLRIDPPTMSENLQ